MIRYENECVGCPAELGCLGSSCPYAKVEHHYCDGCGCEIFPDETFEVDGEELCEDCLKNMFEERW